MSDDPKPQKPSRGWTGEWPKLLKDQIPASVLTVFAQREEQNDKKDSRTLLIIAGFGLLGWLGFLILGGHEIVTRVNALTGEAELRANRAEEVTP